MSRARDFTWFRKEFPGLGDAYCLTLVRAVEPDEALTCFGVTGRRVEASLTEFQDAYSEDPEPMMVAAVSVDGWTLLIEPNGYLGTDASILKSASKGTLSVSHWRNVNAHARFYWAVDGEIRVGFDPLFCEDRYGSQPDALVAEMIEAGFNPHRQSFDEVPQLAGEAAFALAANMTGVQLTAELLNTSTYLVGRAPDPRWNRRD